jgi:tetratricopeptide (TPR) repeat protein
MHLKAQHNHAQAWAKLVEWQSYLEVYGTRLADVAQDGLEFIEAALQINPASSDYCDTKGLLLAGGLGDHREALRSPNRALELEPDSVVIKQNIRDVKNLLEGRAATSTWVVWSVVGASAVGLVVLLPGPAGPAHR